MHSVLRRALIDVLQQDNVPHNCLQSDVRMWNMKMCDETANELARAVLAVVIIVAKKLQQDRALLRRLGTVLRVTYIGLWPK